MQVDSRGYGGSDGCYDFGGLGEQMDAEAAVNWAAAQPWSNGNVGMWGKSYDAWTQVMALAGNPLGLKAAVIQAPIIDGYRIAFMNGVHYQAGWYATPALYAGYDLAPSSAGDRAPEEVLYPAVGTATNPHCYAVNLGSTALPDRSLPYWQERELSHLAATSTVPVLWSHGFNDANTKPDNFLPVYAGLRGSKAAWLGQWDHVRGNEVDLVGRDGFMDQAMHLFDRHLKGIRTPSYPSVHVQTGQGWWRTEEAWPPRDARRRGLRLLEGTYPDGPRSPLLFETGTWTFTQPAPHRLHLAGTPRLTAYVAAPVPGATLIAQLYDVDKKGRARLISRGAFRLSGSGAVTFDLYPQDWVVRKNHRFGIRLTATDSFFAPTYTQTEVQILGGRVSVPFLRYRRTPTLQGGDAEAMQLVREVRVPPELIEERTRRSSFPPPPERR